jgi:hypothetical protein
VQRRPPLPALAFCLLALACNDDALQTPDQTDTDPIVASTGEELCIPGHEACACAAGGVCLDGLQCLSELCVEMPVADSSSDGGTTEGSGTTSAVDDESTSSTGAESTESSSSSTSGGEESSTSTGPTTECFDGDTFCQLGSGLHLTCVEDEWIAAPCADSCLVTGHTGEDCADNQQECVCEGFSDYDCEIAMEVTCYCYFEEVLGDGCTSEDRENLYQMCFQDTEPAVACMGSYFTDAGLDCDAAVDNCL